MNMLRYWGYWIAGCLGMLAGFLLFGGWFVVKVNGIQGRILAEVVPAMAEVHTVSEKYAESLVIAEDGILKLQDRSEQRIVQLHEQFQAHVEQTEKRNRDTLIHLEETAADIVRTLCLQDREWCSGFEVRSGLLNIKKRQDALEEQMRLQTKALEELTKGK